MTVIIGLCAKDIVYLGADSCGSDDTSQSTCLEPKLFSRRGFSMAYTGSFRFGQIMQHAFKLPRRQKKDTHHGYLVVRFIKAMRDALWEHGCLHRDETSIEEVDGGCLLAYRRHLWVIEADFQVREALWETAGIGADTAWGALYAAAELPPEERVMRALNAAAERNLGVRGPMKVIVVKK